MTAGNFAAALAFTLSQEGGFSDNPADPGGATNMGITLATYRQTKPDASVDDLRAMTQAEASTIYQASYWNQARCDDLPSGVDLSIFDAGVNTGDNAVRQLQQIVGATIDGVVGDETVTAVGKMDATTLVVDLHDAQMSYYESLSDFATFGQGWSARCDARRVAALALITPAPSSGGWLHRVFGF